MDPQPLVGVTQGLEIGQMMGQGDRQFVVIGGLVQDLQHHLVRMETHVCWTWAGPSARAK